MSAFPVTVLLGDPRLPDRTRPGGRFTPDDLDQVRRLKAALGELPGLGFEFIDDHERLADALRGQRSALVLNFCDTGYRNDARLELHVAALLEMLGLDYSGSGPVALGLCYDKALVRALADAQGVPVPREAFLAPGDPLPELVYPAFVKPNCADGSVGISARSIVHDAAEARACIDRLRAELPGEAVIAQEFLSGDEYGVGLVRNPGTGFTTLPVLEVDYDALDPSLPRLLDDGSKTDPDSPYWTDVRFRAADLSEATVRRMASWCETLFERLGMRDYGRFDFRADARGEIKLLEVNPNPAWCWDGKLAHMAGIDGRSHAWLLGKIIEAARARHAAGR